MNPTRSFLILRMFLLVVVALLALLWGVGVVNADTVRLKPGASVDQPVVMLSDIAWLEGPEAQRWAALIVAEPREGAVRYAVNLEDVRALLTARGVNWARLSLKGVATCEVRLLNPPAAPVNPQPEPVMPSLAPVGYDTLTAERGAPIAATTTNPLEADAPLDVRSLVLRELTRLLGVAGDELTVNFAERDADVLNMSTVAARFTVEPVGPARLGRLRLVVRKASGLGAEQTYALNADISRKTTAVVATAPVLRGQLLTPANVALREVELWDSRFEPIRDVDTVLGAAAEASLRPGNLVRSEHLGTALVVRRGDMVTVRVVSGGVMVDTDGFAEGDAGVGQTVQVRLDRQRGRGARVVSAVATGPGRVQVGSPERRSEQAPQLAAKE